MKSKLDLAHEYAMECLRHMNQMKLNCCEKKLSAEAWKYADAMQAEADKRNQDSRSLTKDQEGNCLHFHHDFGHKKCMDCGASLQEWQPDWSQAPDDCYWFGAIYNGREITGGWFFTNEPCVGVSGGQSIYSSIGDSFLTGSFGYTGDWKESIRKRPEDK